MGGIPLSLLALEPPALPPVIERTEAVLLRVRPFSNTSHMLTWLTREGMRLTTSVKGAVRPKSAFLGQYDLYYLCEILWYAHASGDVHVLRECEPIETHDHLRENWRAALAAGWFAALADVVAETQSAVPGLYALLLDTLATLNACEGAPPLSLFARFEAKALAEAGLRPNLAACPHCIAEGLYDAEQPIHFDMAAGVSHCHLHTPFDPLRPSPGLVRVSTPTMRLINAMMDSTSVGPSSSLANLSDEAVLPVLRFLGVFLHYHLPDAPLGGRSVTLAPLLKK